MYARPSNKLKSFITDDLKIYRISLSEYFCLFGDSLFVKIIISSEFSFLFQPTSREWKNIAGQGIDRELWFMISIYTYNIYDMREIAF